MRRARSPEHIHGASRGAIGAALLLGLALVPQVTFAECGCLWEGSFADVQHKADIVIAARVLSRKGNAVDVTVEQPLRGDPYRDTVRVWMQARDYCRPTAEEFPDASRWVMALHRIDEVPEGGFDPGTPNISYGRPGDYYLSSCGGYWLQRQGEAVTGNLVDGPRWAREVEMTPVLLTLLQAFLDGNTDATALAEASREDPALTELLLDTKAFLRGQAPPDLEQDDRE